ncbi:MAG: hypothetical protein IJL74_04005 [Bacilli bacterium]|nr:hypothetical protein [Bacilli bacterium]
MARQVSLEKYIIQMEHYLDYLKQLSKDDPETAKILAMDALIKTGVLNEDGTPKESIVDEPPYVGYYTNNKPSGRVRK